MQPPWASPALVARVSGPAASVRFASSSRTLVAKVLAMNFCKSIAFLILPSLLVASPPVLIGPFGGSASVVQVDPYQPDVVVAGTSNALLFRSTNGGDSWARLPFPGELRATLHAFTITPTGLYLVGLANNNHAYSGLFLSADHGQSWSRPKALSRKDIWSIAAWRRDARVIAVGTSDGIYLSRDGGEDWARISPESNLALMPVVSIDFDGMDSQVLYAGTPHLPWKTLDGGKTWQPAHTGMRDDSDVFSIHVDPNRPTQVFASACTGVYRSSNRAVTWVKLVGARDASYRTYQITQDPIHPNILLAGTTRGLEKSIDSGKTWRKLSSEVTRSIVFDPNHVNRIYVATDNAGLFRSDDLGETLHPMDEGFCNRHLVSLVALGTTLYASSAADGAIGFFRSSSEGRWESIHAVPPLLGQRIVKVLPLDPTHLYVLTSTSILLSPDAGLTWNVFGPRIGARLTDLVAPTPGGRRLLVSTDDGVYSSEDDGLSWQRARLDPEHASIRSLVALGPKSIAAISRHSILISADGEEYRTVSAPATGSEIYAVIVTDRGTLLAATSHGLRRSEDLGATWRSVDGDLGASTVSALCKHPLNPKILFAARYGTVYRSEDDGLSWKPITGRGEELPAIRNLVIPRGMPDSLLAVTNFQGVFAVHLDSEDDLTECHGRNCELVRIQIQ